MLDTLGFARGVLVQGSAHGRDNSATLDALATHPNRLRGVAVADATVTPEEMRRLDRLGVRGLRFNHFFRDGKLHYGGRVTLSPASEMVRRVANLRRPLPPGIDGKDLPAYVRAGD